MEIDDDANEGAFLTQTLEQTSIEPRLDPFASYPSAVQREIERLTDLLFFPRSHARRRQIILVEMEPSNSSSLWLASGIASVLCSVLRQTVYVLSVNLKDASNETMLRRASSSSPSSLPSSYFVECLSETESHNDIVSLLTDRLSTLQNKGYPVIVHLPYEQHAGVLARAGSIEGVVLISRASRTRRTELEAIKRSLAVADIPLLGSVLLDRVNPIPEKLYRLL
jgi:hypothetical protein